jgi:hypothetical protein
MHTQSILYKINWIFSLLISQYIASANDLPPTYMAYNNDSITDPPPAYTMDPQTAPLLERQGVNMGIEPRYYILR